MSENTEVIYQTGKIDALKVKIILNEVFSSLEELEYDPIKQIASYLQSGDLSYISTYKNCREKIALLQRSDILEALLKEYLCDI